MVGAALGIIGTAKGGASSILKRVEITSTSELSNADVINSFITNYGMGSATETTLPAYSGAAIFTIMVETAGQNWDLYAPYGESLFFDGTEITPPLVEGFASGYINIGQNVGDSLICYRRRIGSASYVWDCRTISGTHTITDAETGIFEFDVVSTQTIAGVFSTTEQITVYWGDGTNDTYNGENKAYSKNYGSVGNRTVVIAGSSGDVITKFTMTQSGANISFALADAPSGLTSFTCIGSNSISGDLADLPSGLTYFYCAGYNTISGDIADLPVGLTTFYCGGSNTISGDIADAPSGLTSFTCIGSNSISGDLTNLPVGLIYFYCAGYNTISDYGGTLWRTASMDRIYLIPVGAGGLSQAEVDDLLIDLDVGVVSWTGTKTILLTGTNAARSAASDAAVASLIGKGVSVTTN